MTLITVFLFGCQNESGNTRAEENNADSKEMIDEKLLFEGEITKVEVSKVKGIDPVIYEEGNELATFNDLFSSATIYSGTVNVTNPEFYLKLTNEDGGIERLHLWLGDENEESMLMNIQDTNKVYTMTTGMSVKLNELISK